MMKTLYYGQPDPKIQIKKIQPNQARSSSTGISKTCSIDGVNNKKNPYLDHGTGFSPEDFERSRISTPTPAAEEENIFNFPREIPSRQSGKQTIRKSTEKMEAPMTPMINDNLPRSEIKFLKEGYSASNEKSVIRKSTGEEIKRKIEGFNVSIKDIAFEERNKRNIDDEQLGKPTDKLFNKNFNQSHNLMYYNSFDKAPTQYVGNTQANITMISNKHSHSFSNFQEEIKTGSKQFCKSRANAGDNSLINISRETFEQPNIVLEAFDASLNKKRSSELDNSISVFLAPGVGKIEGDKPATEQGTEHKMKDFEEESLFSHFESRENTIYLSESQNKRTNTGATLFTNIEEIKQDDKPLMISANNIEVSVFSNDEENNLEAGAIGGDSYEKLRDMDYIQHKIENEFFDTKPYSKSTSMPIREELSTNKKDGGPTSRDQSGFLETLRSELSRIVKRALDETSQNNIMEIFKMMRENLHKYQLRDAVQRQEINKIKREKEEAKELLEIESKKVAAIEKKLEEEVRYSQSLDSQLTTYKEKIKSLTREFNPELNEIQSRKINELTVENEELARAKTDLEQIVKNILFEKELKKYQSQSGSSTAHSVSSFKADSIFESHTPSKLQRSSKSNLLGKKQVYRTFRDEPQNHSFELKNKNQILNGTPFGKNKGIPQSSLNVSLQGISVNDKENTAVVTPNLKVAGKNSKLSTKNNSVILNEVLNVQQLLQAQNSQQNIWQTEVGGKQPLKKTSGRENSGTSCSIRTSTQRSSLNTSVPEIKPCKRDLSSGSNGGAVRAQNLKEFLSVHNESTFSCENSPPKWAKNNQTLPDSSKSDIRVEEILDRLNHKFPRQGLNNEFRK